MLSKNTLPNLTYTEVQAQLGWWWGCPSKVKPLPPPQKLHNSWGGPDPPPRSCTQLLGGPDPSLHPRSCTQLMGGLQVQPCDSSRPGPWSNTQTSMVQHANFHGPARKLCNHIRNFSVTFLVTLFITNFCPRAGLRLARAPESALGSECLMLRSTSQHARLGEGIQPLTSHQRAKRSPQTPRPDLAEGCFAGQNGTQKHILA